MAWQHMGEIDCAERAVGERRGLRDLPPELGEEVTDGSTRLERDLHTRPADSLRVGSEEPDRDRQWT